MKPLFTLLLLLAVQVTFAYDSGIIFVNQHAIGNSDGSSWENAFTGLDDALEQASAGQQIWVAAGSYHPARKTGGNTDFHYAFVMVQGVEIYGGFAGNENPENFHLNQRNFGLNETFLSGIIPSELKSMAPAVYHVIRNQNNNLDSTAVLDGFTISNGAAIGSGRDAKGGGIINVNSHPTLRNLTFINNMADTHGGAIFNENSHPHIINCTFDNNSAEWGGAISNDNSSPLITKSVFTYNQARGGGAIHNDKTLSHPTITESTFMGNEASDYGAAIFNFKAMAEISNCNFHDNTQTGSGTNFGGGAIFNYENSPVITNSNFTNNTAAENGGAIFNLGTASAQVFTEISGSVFQGNEAIAGGALFNGRFAHVHVTASGFEENIASRSGGAIYNNRNNTQIHHSTFINNMALGTGSSVGGGAIYNNTSASLEGNAITHSKFENNHAHIGNARGGAIFNNLNPGHFTMESSVFDGNTAQYGGGIYNNAGNNNHADNSSVQITGTSFINHTATYGAGIYNNRHHVQITSARFSGNHATASNASGAGGGIYSYYGTPLIINSLFTGNKADNHGAALAGNQTEITLINTTISGNFAARGGAFAGITRASATIKNSIVTGNRATVDGNQLFLCANCEASANHSIVANENKDIYLIGGASYNPLQTSSVDPLFTNPVYPTFQNTPNTLGTYMIAASSPALDNGHNNHFPISTLKTDFRGVDRIVDGSENGNRVIDIGAYEFYSGQIAPLVPASGNGTATQPYHVQSLENLYWIAQDRERWSLHYIQTANIDASPTENWYDGKGWDPIGNQQHHFTGNYNGNGHYISEIFINRPDQNHVGLFGSLQSGARVSMLGLYGVNITGGQNTGGLAGSITGEWANRTVLAETSVTGTVNGKDNTGGLVGAGGYHADIFNSFTRATVTGAWATGGLAGSYWGGTGEIHNSYAASEVNGNPSASGGLVATGQVSVFNSYWDTEVSTVNFSNGGTGLPSAQMKELSTFTSWDFQRIWDIYTEENDGYPFLIAMGSPLPVNLIHFSAEPGDGIIEIHWVTASEVNSEKFTIEHSHDGIQWIAIGSVKAAGNSNDLVYYMFLDHNPYHGITYYRLIQTDFDGTTEVFGPVYAENRPKNMHAEPATLFPNPNNGNFTITVGYSPASLERGDYDIQVLSVTGKVVYSKTYKDLSFAENIGLELQDIPPGVYFVNIYSTFEGPQSIPFVKSN